MLWANSTQLLKEGVAKLQTNLAKLLEKACFQLDPMRFSISF